MDWTAHLKETSETLATFRQMHPEAGQGFTALHRGTMAEGHLDVKTKELIALSIGVSTRCVDCIGFHVQAAAKAGATREDVAEAVGVAMMMGGGPAYMYGVKAIEAYDQLTKTP